MTSRATGTLALKILRKETLLSLNERIPVALQRGGSTYLSNARVHGHFALRGCVLNYRTTARDMEIALEDVRRAASQTS
ncbi:MAG: hypothetical protein LAP87_15990 [Acidobacteriia bacterium]|nr:hypothetical protein [Terriglobia bacterium]